MPGKGWSSPVVENGRIWVTTAVGPGPSSLRALGIDTESGKIVHNVELFDIPSAQGIHPKNSPASPTPIIDSQRVYCHFGSYGTACLSAENGSILWKQTSLKVEHEVGPGSSPVLFKGLLIIPFDGTNEQFVAAVRTDSGRIAWKVPRAVSLDDRDSHNRKAFSTPLLISVARQTQVVIPGAEYVYSYEPETGQEIWRVHHPGSSNIGRPVFADGVVVVTTGYPRHELWAIRADGKGDVTASHVLWKYTRQVPAKPSPLIAGERVYMISDGGIATCLDLKSGREIWQERVGGEYSASPLYAAGRIYFFSESGDTILIAPEDHFKILGKNQLPGTFLASPAVVEGSLFFRSAEELLRIDP